MPEVMAAAVYQSPGVITIEERPVPHPGPDEVVVRVHSCGICGSDIHQLRDGWGLPPGVVAGHEWSGTIAAIGDNVTSWSVGELVVGGSSPRCGTCRRCLEGKPSQCENRNDMTSTHSDGAFAEYILCRAAGVLRLPEGLAPRHAALAEPLSVAMHGITRSNVQPGDSVMVFGAGPIGALSIAALRAMGIDDVTVVEPHPGRRELAGQARGQGDRGPVRSRGLPFVGARAPVDAGPRTWCSSARDTAPPSRPASARWPAAASS